MFSVFYSGSNGEENKKKKLYKMQHALARTSSILECSSKKRRRKKRKEKFFVFPPFNTIYSLLNKFAYHKCMCAHTIRNKRYDLHANKTNSSFGPFVCLITLYIQIRFLFFLSPTPW